MALKWLLQIRPPQNVLCCSRKDQLTESSNCTFLMQHNGQNYLFSEFYAVNQYTSWQSLMLYVNCDALND